VEHLIERWVDWGVASRPLAEEELGDAALVHPLPDGVLIGVVDGLGHGAAAARASREAVRLLSASNGDHPVAALRRCHEGLRATRGVVLTLAWLDGRVDCLTWLGVGNVQGVLLHARPGADVHRETMIGRNGVVGRNLPAMSATHLPIAHGDLLILATDGIRPGFADRAHRPDPPQQVADAILAEHRTGTDDALVLVVRYRGKRP
jgi:serine/threonine protein phosphatase PrpC